MTELPDIPYLNMVDKSLMWSPFGLLVQYANTYTQINADGNQTHYYHGDVYSAPGSATAFGNTLAVCNTDHISLYNLESGEETGVIKLPPFLQMEDGGKDVPVIAAIPDEAGLLYCNSTGVYRITTDGSLTERLIDSYQFALDHPGTELLKAFAEPDGSLLLLLKRNRNYHLVRFTFDPLADRLPQQEITIYSLVHVPYIRNAVRLYQARNPETAVTYRVGYTGEDNFSLEDALRSLSIELAAGRGADILILDGVPFMEYLTPGTLMDLSGLLEEEAGSGPLLENITGAYRTERGLFAVPTRFSVPLLAGQGIKKIHSAEDLRAWLENNRGMYSGGYPAEIIRGWYYNACSWGWLNVDGSRNNAAISGDLETLRAVEALLSLPDDNGGWQDRFIAAKYITGEVPFMMATMDSMMASKHYIFALSNPYGGIYQPMTGMEHRGVFIPQSILGVNEAAANKEGVTDFARFLLSREAQAADLRDGFPIREDAIGDI